MYGGSLLQRAVAMLTLLTLAACATHQVDTPRRASAEWSLDPGLFGQRPEIIAAEELFILHDSQALEFLNFFDDPAQQEVPPHARIYEYLLHATADFDFHNDTRTASQALDSSSGNCLSLAILTTALANLVNVDVGYQLVDSTPVFERRGDVVSKGVHVRSILYDPTWQPQSASAEAWQRPGIRFDYFPEDTARVRLLGNLSAAAYVAMYYSNVAAEAIANGDIDSAFWYLLESLEHKPENPIALNMLAVVYRRAGDAQTAEQIYQHGIASLPKNASFLRNYYYLLKSQERTTEAESIGRTLAKLDDQNPFNWVNAGRSALDDGQYREAIRHLKQALEIAPYLHEAHAMMAIAHLKMGNKGRGERELQRALDNAQRQEARSLYQAKLALLER